MIILSAKTSKHGHSGPKCPNDVANVLDFYIVETHNLTNIQYIINVDIYA